MPPLAATVRAPNDFLFPTLADRPFRIISIETEVDGDKFTLPETLYAKGYVETPQVERYGYYPPQGYSCLGFIKYDGSVTGGEVVFDRLNLTDQSVASILHEAYAELYMLERTRVIATNPNCGGHITIDAAGYGHYDLLRLLTVFGYLEEPIFRLAGAGKKYGHRSLYPGHDRAAGGGGYANAVVKGPFVPQKDGFTKAFGMRRMSAINITKMMYNQCRCSASENDANYITNDRGTRWYDQKRCTCTSYNKCFEWRIWNSQTNPRILYGWIGLMQALHAYAYRPWNTHSYKQVEHLDPLDWRVQRYSALSDQRKKKAQERVEWMFTELPLTAEEKSALVYAFMRTPYKNWGRDWFKRLANTPYKPPPYKNNYSTKIHRAIRNKKGGDVANALPFEEPERHPALVQMRERGEMEAELTRIRDRRWFMENEAALARGRGDLQMMNDCHAQIGVLTRMEIDLLALIDQHIQEREDWDY